MKTTFYMIRAKTISRLTLGLAAGLLVCLGADTCLAQELPSGVQEVVKLTQAGVSDDVILTQVRNNQATYNLTADQIIALKDMGVSQPVIRALIGGGSTVAVTAAPPTTLTATVAETAAPAVTLESFKVQLASAGSWIQVPGVGLCWQPTVVNTTPGWRPYFDHGHWVYTDAGWSWESDYAWGNIVFHYGRWTRFHGHWVWKPGYDWAPAWVSWREADGYCGWAPLPPAAVYRPGLGLYFRGGLAVDVDFGLAVDDFCFVAYDHFWDADFRLHLLPRERLGPVFHGSRIVNGYRVDHGQLVVEGLGHEHMAALTHHEVRVVHDVREAHVRDGHDDHDVRDARDWHDDHFQRADADARFDRDHDHGNAPDHRNR